MALATRITGGNFWRNLNPRQLLKAAEQGLKDALPVISEAWAAEAKLRSPLRTGALRASIRSVANAGSGAVGLDLVFYGKVLEFSKRFRYYAWMSNALREVMRRPRTRDIIRRAIDRRVRAAIRAQGGTV